LDGEDNVAEPKDYRIEIKVRNNRLLTKMEGAGYPSVAKFAEALGMNRHTIYRIVQMRSAALDEEGYYRPEALRIAEFLNCTPQDIYPPAQMRGTMKENTAQITANANEVDSLTSSLRTLAFSPEHKMILNEAKQALKTAMMTLTPKEQRILDLRYGLTYGEEKTLDEVGAMFGVSRERIRQQEMKALRKMRHPSKSKELRANLNELTIDPLEQK
jgi:RNA polymerase sigma factor (sigma-70 family)